MKKFLLASAALIATAMSVPALAADLPVRKAAPVYVPPAYSWTGFYLGGNLGWIRSGSTITDVVTGASLETSGANGFMGGGQVGFNYQFNWFVLGIEGDFDATSLKRTSAVVPTAIGNLQASASTPWVSSLAARFGFALDRFFFYGKAGVGWVQNDLTISNLTTGASVSANNTNNGFLWGIGGEFAIDPNWSVKVEYDRLNLKTWTVVSPVAGDQITAQRNIDMVKLGFNYKFGYGAARY
jgi:outer membrane immunogenic protein